VHSHNPNPKTPTPTHTITKEGMDRKRWPLRWLFHPFLFWKSTFSFGYRISHGTQEKWDTKTNNLYVSKVFPLNSQGVPIKFSMCSSRGSQQEHILSHMFCPKLISHRYKLWRGSQGKHFRSIVSILWSAQCIKETLWWAILLSKLTLRIHHV
jgi:hypothetical protein